MFVQHHLQYPLSSLSDNLPLFKGYCMTSKSKMPWLPLQGFELRLLDLKAMLCSLNNLPLAQCDKVHLFIIYYTFYCYKQSLKRLLHPSIHLYF